MPKAGFGRRFLLVWFLGALLCGCAVPQQSVNFTPKAGGVQTESGAEQRLENMTYAELLEKGDGYLAQGNLALAKLHFLQALTLRSTEAPLFARLGDLFLAEGNQQKSRLAFAEALQIDPNHLPALLGSARRARLAGDWETAERHLLHLRQLVPEHREALTELAICYDAQQRFAEAEALYRQVAELQPIQPAALNNLGFHYLLQGNFGQAVEVLQDARKMAGQDRQIMNNLAAAYILNGEEGRGLVMFKSSLGKAEAFNNLGYIRMMRGELAQAERAFLQALELNPSYYVRAAKNLDYLKSLAPDEQAGREEPVEKTTAIN